MKAMRVHQFGGPELLRYEDAPEPQVQPGQVLVNVRAIGVNPSDLIRLAAGYPGPKPPLPYITGRDVCGEVEAVGAGVTKVKKGDRVYGRAIGAAYAEKTLLMESEAVHLPSNLSFSEGAAIPIAFFTAYYALHHKAGVKAGETVLVQAGGGGVGVGAIQLAKVAGAKVITTVGSKEKADKTLDVGADVAINYKEQDFVAEVMKNTDGKGANVIIESVASENLGKDLMALAPGGRIVVVGTGTGKSGMASINPGAILGKLAHIMGMSLQQADALIPEIGKAISGLLAEKKIRVIITKEYPLSEGRQALEDLLAGKVFGKLVLIP